MDSILSALRAERSSRVLPLLSPDSDPLFFSVDRAYSDCISEEVNRRDVLELDLLIALE